ncbi:hypothetical protein [Mucilaginibacter celer]|uniref:Uncharacterized protein n=1 Tax=Mucilaginibacter celer TaxID=2305508 RepID=A0A494VYZ8_9SPHI|nr:hypothetical protein [Mucilaginibacter celer]AYL96222.1 hypothetical protein HYN43_013375 [Mucilaginibacter celer]
MILLPTPPIGEISQADAQEMVTAYNAAQNGLTKSVWFGLDQIEELVKRLKDEQAAGFGTDGLRVYFARYTENTIPEGQRQFIGKNTVVLVSTKKVKGENGIEFHEDYFDGIEPNQKKVEKTISSKDSPPENRGELCQPQCNGTKL